MRCARYLVGGRVQGVGFRAHARAQAVRLGLVGHARNLEDGRVEVVACGAPEVLDAFERWLGNGPPLARVVSLSRESHEEADEASTTGFTIR